VKTESQNFFQAVRYATGVDRLRKDKHINTAQRRLDRERLFILPTYYGVVFGLMLLIMLLGSLNYNNSLGFMLTFLLSGLSFVSILHTYRNVIQLSLKPGKTPPIFAGQDARFGVIVDNLNGQPRYAISIRAANSMPTIFNVNGDSHTTVYLPVPTDKRGRQTLDIITVATRYPLGLYRAWSYFKLDATCLVYPKPAADGGLHVSSLHDNGQLSRTNAGSDDFMGLRKYHPGDSIKHINWKAVARGQQAMTKQYATNESSEIWLDWSETAGTHVEDRLSQLCRWVLDAHEMGVNYGLKIPGRILEPANGDAHRHRCLEALALFEEQP
jgi:uncharacterized protein (DUF58 family)